jgi:hypothetical protein
VLAADVNTMDSSSGKLQGLCISLYIVGKAVLTLHPPLGL